MGAMWKSRPEACDSDSETASMQVSDIVLLGGSGIGPSLAGRLEDAEAHNRSVLKERRITPGALTCFAVAECWGWRLGLVGGGGSAGSVLRSQGTLGPVELSRGRARGIKVSTFLCSLRPGPAAAGLIGSLSLNGVVIVAYEKK